MNIDREEILAAHQSAERIETELRLPSGFVFGLLDENDWAFVIKLYALFESAMTLSVSRCLLDSHPGGLHSIIQRLDSGDSRRGKLAFASSLGLIEPQDKKFIVKLAELRNTLAHTIENVAFDFQGALSLFDSRQRAAFISGFTSSNGAYAQSSGFGNPLNHQDVLDNPKEFVFLGALDVLHVLECATPPIELKLALISASEAAKHALIHSLFTDPDDSADE